MRMTYVRLTVGVTADSDLLALAHIMLDHGRLFPRDVHDCKDDLVGILLGDLLAVLKSLNHVLNEVECHLVAQLCAIVATLQYHVVDVKALRDRRRVIDFNSLQEGISLDDLLAVQHAQLRSRI